MKGPKQILTNGKIYLQDTLFNGKSFWFILFLTLLAVLSIRASHSVDEKVLEISVLKNNLKELEAEYLESKSVNIIGGCCGTTPKHIKLIAEEANNFSPRNLIIDE